VALQGPVGVSSTTQEQFKTPVKPSVITTTKIRQDDDEADEEEEDSDMDDTKQKRTSMSRPTRPIPPPNIATAIPSNNGIERTKIETAVVAQMTVPEKGKEQLKKDRKSALQPLPPVIEEGNDSLVAREALEEFSVAATYVEDTVTTTQVCLLMFVFQTFFFLFLFRFWPIWRTLWTATWRNLMICELKQMKWMRPSICFIS
jgi:hypothetical protein